MFRSELPKVGFFTSTHGEGWENTVGDAEGGLLLGVTSTMNIFSLLLDLWRIKKAFALPSSPVTIGRLEFETVSCHADIVCLLEVLSAQAKAHYRLR